MPANAVQKVSSNGWVQCAVHTFLNHVAQVVYIVVKTAMPAIEFVIRHPWVLVPLLHPALQAWLVLLSFEAGGILVGDLHSC